MELFAAWCLHKVELSHEVLPAVCLLVWKLCRPVVCASAYVLRYVALSPSCRLLENSAILDQYERASLTYEKAARGFTPAWCWWRRDTLSNAYWISIHVQRWTQRTRWIYFSCSALKREAFKVQPNLLRCTVQIFWIENLQYGPLLNLEL